MSRLFGCSNLQTMQSQQLQTRNKGKRFVEAPRRRRIQFSSGTLLLVACCLGSISCVSSDSQSSTKASSFVSEMIVSTDQILITQALFWTDDDTNTSDERWSTCRKGQTCILKSIKNESYGGDGVNGNDLQSWYSQIIKISNSIFLMTATRIAPFYWELLEIAPVMTKSITACFIGGIGDASAQLFERRFVQGRRFDLRRTLSVAVEGLLISGPLMHYVYDWMETILPLEGGEGFCSWIHAMIHVLIDSLVLDCVFVATLMIFTGILEGKIDVIPTEFRKDFIPTVKASWVSNLLFSPLEFIVFKFVPAKLRVLAINLQDIIWNAIVSYMAHRSRNQHD